MMRLAAVLHLARGALDPRGVAYVGVLCALAALFFANTVEQPFSYDDQAYLDKARATTEDPSAFLRHESIADSRYLAHAYFLAAWQLFGMDPQGYHFVNVLVHLLNAWLTARLCLRWLGRVLTAGLAGVVFLVSTVAFEAIYWISAAPILLAATAALGSALLWDRCRRTGRRRFGALSLLAFLAAFLCYEPAGVLAIPLALATWRDSNGRGPWPWYFVATAMAALLGVVVLDQVAFGNLRAREPNYTVGPHIVTNVGFFLGRWALNQFASPTGWDSIDPADVARSAFGAYAIVGGGVAALLVWLAWRRRQLAVAVVWMLAAVLPFAAWDNQAYFPRYWYLAQVSGSLVIAWLAGEFFGGIRAGAARRGAAAVFGLIVVVLAFDKTVQYTWRYQLKAANYAANYGDPRRAIGLYEDLLDKLPSKALALKYNLGSTYLDLGDLPRAEQWLEQAVREDPRHLGSALMYAKVLLDAGRTDEGLAVLTHAAQLGPEGLQTVNQIVGVLAAAGNPMLAERLRSSLSAR